jgi:hypothetical protein
MSKLNYIKVAWLLVFLAITVTLIATYNTTTHRDNEIVLVYAQIALTFPTGICVMAFLARALDLVFSVQQLPSGKFGMVIMSVLFATAGYAQWFVLIPAGWRLVSRRSDK